MHQKTWLFLFILKQLPHVIQLVSSSKNFILLILDHRTLHFREVLLTQPIIIVTPNIKFIKTRLDSNIFRRIMTNKETIWARRHCFFHIFVSHESQRCGNFAPNYRHIRKEWNEEKIQMLVDTTGSTGFSNGKRFLMSCFRFLGTQFSLWTWYFYDVKLSTRHWSPWAHYETKRFGCLGFGVKNIEKWRKNYDENLTQSFRHHWQSGISVFRTLFLIGYDCEVLQFLRGFCEKHATLLQQFCCFWWKYLNLLPLLKFYNVKST